LWQHALEDLRARWLETADRQQSHLASALEAGTSNALAAHSRELAEASGVLLEGSRTVAAELARVADTLRDSTAESSRNLQESIRAVWERMHLQMASARDAHQAQIAATAELLGDTMHGWHDGLSRAVETMSAQLAEVVKQGETLRGVLAQEEQLAQLQSSLVRNLEAIQAAGAFEESLDSLNAAIRLLATRARARAA
jgi:hypothetical protein